MTSKKIENVMVLPSGAAMFARRQSNQLLLVPRSNLPDSTSIYLEDTNGYRYARDIANEQFEPSCYLFRMI